MRFQKFDMNLLVVLDALLTEQNITRAGEKLFLSQSATSGALARLRDYFDDPLLVQVGRKMILTRLAESLAQPVRDLLIQTQTTLETRPDLEVANFKQRVSFIMSDYSSMVVMPEVVRKASKIAPGVSFEFLSPGDNPMHELDQNNVDFLLMPGKFLTENHPSVELFVEDFVCICDANNELLGEKISAEQYCEMGHIEVAFGSKSRPGVDAILASEMGLKRTVEVTVNTYSVIPQYVSGTNRIATVHRRLAEFWAKLLPIKVVELDFELAQIPWRLQWHQYKDIDPVTNWVKELMIETLRR